jgi:gluconate 2-dehydrogenase alpha chain
VKKLKPVDVVISGGGWTGLAMAKEIASRTSLSVMVLERGGPPRKYSDYLLSMDELDYAIRMRMMQNISQETITHRHSVRDSAAPMRQYGSFLPGSGVGGAGEHWNGVSYRFLPDQFTLRTHLSEKHGEKNLPEDLSVEDWGVTYDDLEAQYWHAEQMLGVSGKAGNLRGKLMDGGNTFEGPRANEYPTPPLKHSYLNQLFNDGARKLGYHPYPLPAANLSQSYRNPDGILRSACVYCGYCERFGCMIGAKAQPSNTLLPLLENRKNFQMQTGAWVRRIVHENGRATGLQYTDAAGEDYFQPAGIVVLASWTLNNVRLLYLSKLGKPYDPAARTGTLGRNLTHQVQGNTRIFLDKPLNLFMGSGSLGFRISDFDGSSGFTEKDGVLRGGTLGSSSYGNRPIASFGDIPQDTVKKKWGPEWKAAALAWRDRTAALGLAGEHLAYRQNYMDLDPVYSDKFGDPLIRFTLDWTAHEYRQRDFFAQLAVRVAQAMGARTDEIRPASGKYDVSQYQTTHIQGGAIMGTSAEKSVVNTHLQHWDSPNLWVLGASAFPQNASGNPTLTALALTYRAADALINRYLKNPGRLL